MRTMKTSIFALAGAAVITAALAAVAAAPAAAADEARISFVQYGGIRDWRADRDDRLFVQDSARRWYDVALMGPCTGLSFANGVRFLPSDSAGTFDRFSSIVANGERCKVDSVRRVDGVPSVRNHTGYRG